MHTSKYNKGNFAEFLSKAKALFIKTPYVTLLVWLGLSFAAVSCSLDNTGANSSLDKNNPVTIELWTISLKPKFTHLMEGMIGEFSAKHPNVKVQWVDLPQQSILQKLMASIAGGVSPDVVNLITSSTLSLARNNALCNVNDLLPKEVIAQYYPNLWNASAICQEGKQNKVYAVPWYVSTRVLMYNLDLLKKAQCPPPKNWDDIALLAAKVKKNTGLYGYSPVVRIIDDWRMADIEIYDPTSGKAKFAVPKACQRLNWYALLYKQNLIPKECLIEGYQGALERYQQGSLAILEAGPQLLLKIAKDAPTVYKNTAVAPLPKGVSGTLPASIMNFVIPRSSKHKELAAQLAAFLTSPANQLKFCKEVPLLPSTYKTTEDAFFKVGKGEKLQDEAVAISLQQLPYAEDFSLSLERSGELEKVLKEAVESTVYGQMSSQDALSLASKRWDEVLNLP